MRGVNFCLGCSSRRDVFYRREEADGARDRRDRATSARFAFEDAARIVKGGRDVSGCDRYCTNGRRGAKKCVCVPRAARPRERRFESDAPRDGHGEHATHHMDGCDVRTLRMAETEISGSCVEAQLTSVSAIDDIMFFGRGSERDFVSDTDATQPVPHAATRRVGRCGVPYVTALDRSDGVGEK